jgi:hypothetical protein
MRRNVKIKDHAEAAIGNLNIRSSLSMSRQDSMQSSSTISEFGSLAATAMAIVEDWVLA